MLVKGGFYEGNHDRPRCRLDPCGILGGFGRRYFHNRCNQRQWNAEPSRFQNLDGRIGVLRAVLQLTPEQQQYWPAIEEAIRARAEARYRRLTTLAGLAQQRGDSDPLALIRARADSLQQRAAGLKRLADAWQPLYQTLTADQKIRMRVVTARVIGGLRHAIEDRRRDSLDDDYDDEG